MSMNRIQFQPGLSMPEFLKQFGTEAQCEADTGSHDGRTVLFVPVVAPRPQYVQGWGAPNISVPGVSPSNFVDRRDAVSKHQTTVDTLVPGDLFYQPS
jgi:hypothetical protein